MRTWTTGFHQVLRTATVLLLTGLVGCFQTGVVPEDIFEGLDETTLRNADSPNTFDGEWVSEEFAYSIEIDNRIGTVTLSNSDAADVGDVLLVITEVRGERFSGRHLFRDGTVQEVLGNLVDDNTLLLTGGGLSWRLTRIDSGVPEGPIDIFDGVDLDEFNNAEPTFTFDGEWLSSAMAYGVRIDNRTGVATLPNSEFVETGDVLLIILDVRDRRFSGRHIFPDGSVQDVVGNLVDQRTLVLTGGGTSWQLTKISPVNTAPLVDAGEDIETTLDDPVVTLEGSFEDDGLPINQTDVTWSVEEDVEGVIIDEPNALTTEVRFTEAGVFELFLEVSDQQLTGSDSVVVVVNEPPEEEPPAEEETGEEENGEQ